MPASLFDADPNDQDARWLVDNGAHEVVPDGTVLLREGHPADAIFVVVEGSFAVESLELACEPLPRLGRGKIAGGVAYVRQRPPRVTVRAVETCQVLRVSYDRLDERAATDDGFARRLRQRAEDAENRIRQEGRRRKAKRTPSPDEPLENLEMFEIIERLLKGEIGNR
jgi:CRP-like cAMP-binding protein